MLKKKPIIPTSMLKIVIPTVIVLGVLVIVVTLNWDVIIQFFQNPERIKRAIQNAGPLAPIVFIAVQFMQIVIAPIPGQVAGLLAGALFGPWLGALYSIIGAFLGFSTVFILAKLLGRPFVERFIKADDLKKFDKITTKAGPLVLFLIFLLPGFPDDVICYLAGLSNIRIGTLVLVSLAGRLPGYIVANLMGAGIGGASVQLFGIIVALVCLGALVFYIYRRPIKRWVNSLMDDDAASQKKRRN